MEECPLCHYNAVYTDRVTGSKVCTNLSCGWTDKLPNSKTVDRDELEKAKAKRDRSSYAGT